MPPDRAGKMVHREVDAINFDNVWVITARERLALQPCGSCSSGSLEICSRKRVQNMSLVPNVASSRPDVARMDTKLSPVILLTIVD